jgi:hypothetical protein
MGRTKHSITNRVRTQGKRLGITTNSEAVLWTEEENNQLIELFKQGHNGVYIAREMNRTNGAVYGQIHRLKRDGRLPKFDMKGRVYQPKEPKQKPLKDNRTEQEIEYDNNSLHLTLLENEGCKWPVSERDTHLFCGRDKLTGKSYCKPHYKRSQEASNAS